MLAAAFDPELEHYDSQAAVRFNPACRLVYFDQSMRDLPLDQSILDYVADVPRPSEKDAIRAARPGRLPLRQDPPSRSALLSHGERARLVFLRMKLLRPNIYLLDEPTNHLDIEGQEALEAQLEQSDVSLPVRLPRPLLHPHRRRRASSRSARAGWSRSTMPRASSTG